MRYPSFIGGSYRSQSPIADGEQTINWYPELVEVPGAKNQTVLYPTPGRRAFVTVTDVGAAGLFAQNSKAWAVMGGALYEVTANATATRRGTVAVNSNPAYLVSNGAVGNQLAVSTGGNVYYLDLSSNAVTQVAGVPATHLGMLDGYFIAFDPTTAKIRISPLNDASGVWDTTQYGQRSLASDPWKAMAVAPPNIWLIGELTGEVWYDSGASPFPLAPYPGAVFGYGTVAPFSLALLDGSPIWLTQNVAGAGQVVRARGYSPEVISDRALDTAIATYARTAKITDAEGWTYQDQGHGFYVLNFPFAGATWVFDNTTLRWHQRGTWNSAAMQFDQWAPRCHAYAFGQHLTGDGATATIATTDVTIGSELGAKPIRRVRRAPALSLEHERLFYDRFELYLETGLGLVTGQGSNPTLLLRTSNDGGQTWSSELMASAGKSGAFTARAFWTRLGSARDRMFEIAVSDPIPWRLIDAYLEITPSVDHERSNAAA